MGYKPLVENQTFCVFPRICFTVQVVAVPHLILCLQDDDHSGHGFSCQQTTNCLSTFVEHLELRRSSCLRCWVAETETTTIPTKCRFQRANLNLNGTFLHISIWRQKLFLASKILITFLRTQLSLLIILHSHAFFSLIQLSKCVCL